MVNLTPSNNVMPSLPEGNALTNTEVSKRSIWINSQYAIKDCYVLARDLITLNRELSKTFIKHSSSRDKFTEVLAIIIGSFAYQLSLGYQRKEFVTIPTGNSSKDAKDRTGYSGEWLAKGVQFLESLDYLYIAYSHFYDRETKQGRIAKYRCTKALISLMERFNLIRLKYPNASRFEVLEEPLQARIKYGDNDYKSVENDPSGGVLKWLAKKLSNTRIKVEGISYKALEDSFNYTTQSSKIFVKPSQLVRTYTTSAELGGRIHLSRIQSLSKEIRSKLLFDGAKTVEFDYRSMHLFLLYRWIGQTLDYFSFPNNDPYDIGQKYGLDRSQIKECFTAVLGEGSESDFLSHTNYHDRQHAGFSAKDRKRALECLLEAHPLIRPYVFKNVSGKLQKADSEIALNVLRFLMDHDIPVIPVHESFIVKRRHADVLQKIMEACLPGCHVH